LASVEPIYIPGLILTGSSHSRTTICEASYSCWEEAETSPGISVSDKNKDIPNATIDKNHH
jgi:hypothetical protein